MKIFLISNMYPSFKNPSYGVFVENAVKELSSLGAEFTCLSVIKDRTKNRYKKILKYARYYLDIVKKYFFGEYDIVYIHFLSHNTPILYLLLLIRGKKRKWVVNVHGSDIVESTGKKIDKYNEKVLRGVDMIVVPSLYFKKLMLNQYPNICEKKYFISPSVGIYTNVFFPILEKEKNNIPLLGYISRIDNGKGWDVFLKALHLLKEEDVRFHATIIGSGEEVKEMEQSIITLKLSRYVSYYPSQSQKELANFYRGFDVFIFPSTLNESLGLVGLEAMACGTPVIGSEKAGIKTYVKDYVNGMLFTPNDAEDLFVKIKEYLLLSEKKLQFMEREAYNTSKDYE